MSTRGNRTLWLVVCVVCLATAYPSFGQATMATISGTVHDVQGARIARATVTVRKLDTNLERSLVTEFDGSWRPLPQLAVVVADVEVDEEYQFERRWYGSNPEQLQLLSEQLSPHSERLRQGSRAGIGRCQNAIASRKHRKRPPTSMGPRRGSEGIQQGLVN